MEDMDDLYVLGLCPKLSFPPIFTQHLGPLYQSRVPPTFFGALSQSPNIASVTRKVSLANLAPAQHFMLENMPSGTQPDKTQYCRSSDLYMSGLLRGHQTAEARITSHRMYPRQLWLHSKQKD